MIRGMIRSAIIAGAILIAFCPRPLHADLSAKEAQALLKEVYRLIQSGQHERAVEELGKGNDIRATKMLLKCMKLWSSKGVDRYKRDVNAHAIRSKIINGFMLIEDPKSWDYLIEQMRGRKYRDMAVVWQRYAIAEALGKKPQEHAFKRCIELIRDEDHQIRALGTFALYHRYGEERAKEAMWEAFGDDRWQVRHLAMLALLKARAPLAQTRYFTRLDESKARERADLLRGLRTMVNKPWALDDWKKWYAKLGTKDKREEFRADFRRYLMDPSDTISRREYNEVLEFKRKPFEGATLFGIKLRTKRLVILFDSHIKLSKEKPTKLPIGTNAKPDDKNLRELMLEEVALAIEKLPKDTQVAVISCDKTAQPIAGKLEALSDPKFLKKVTDALRNRSASSSSNLYSAFERVYSMYHKHPLDDSNFDDGPDTVVLITRGQPEHGKIAYRKVQLRNKAPWNIRFLNAWEQIQHARQIRWHVVGIGSHHPVSFLRTIAERGYGRFVSIGR